MKTDGNLGAFTKLQLRGIDRVLEGEEIIDAIYGNVDRNTGGIKQEKEMSSLVLTPTRVILYHNKVIGGHSSIDYPLRSIHSIDLNVGFIYADIKIHSGNDILKMEKVGKTIAEPFVKNVKTLISKANASTPNVHVSQVSQDSSGTHIDIADQIKKLADLKIQGILTEEEFTAQKKRLLGL